MSRPLRIAVVVSLVLHGAIVAAFLQFNRRPPAVSVAAAPDKPALVELVMREQKGAGQTRVAPPPQPRVQPRSQQTPPPEPKPPETADIAPPPPPARPEQPTPPVPPAPTAQPAPPRDVPEINIGGTDSPSNATVEGRDVIPASPDRKGHNRPPVYPDEAAKQGEQGTVLVVVHVGPSGLADGVAIERSSGYASLDQAAENAVRKWTFVPAMKDGLPVPFDYHMNFQFAFQ